MPNVKRLGTNLTLNNEIISIVDSTAFLRITLDSKITGDFLRVKYT